MSDTFIYMIHNIDFLYGFIYECADLINNLYEYNDYDHLAIKLYNEFVLPIIIIKHEHIKEYNAHIEDTKGINSVCSYLMHTCSEICFKLSQDEYSKIKKFIDNNIDTVKSIRAPMHDFFDSDKKCYNFCCHSFSYHSRKDCIECIKEFCKKYNNILKRTSKIHFNIEYIKFFYLLQKNIDQIIPKKLNLYIKDKFILINMFINLYDNSNIDCNEKVESKIYDIYDNIINKIAIT